MYALTSSSLICRYVTFIAASAWAADTSGFRRAITVSQRLRRLSRSFHVGVICAFIITGTITSGDSPKTTPWKPGWTTPTIVIGWPFSEMFRLSTVGSPAKRRIQ